MRMTKDIMPKAAWDWVSKNWTDDSVSDIAKALMFLAHHMTDEEGHLSNLAYQSERVADALEKISASIDKIEKRGRPDPMYGLF